MTSRTYKTSVAYTTSQCDIMHSYKRRMRIISKTFVRRMGVIMLMGGVLLAISTAIFHTLEGWGWINSFYFSVVTLTTVGYGDLVPTSDISRLVTSIYILLSIPLLFFTIGVSADAVFTNYKSAVQKRKHEEKE